MKRFAVIVGLGATQFFATTIHAQASLVAPEDKAAARAERRANGAAAARNFTPGEGDPKPAPMAKVTRAERAAAREERKPGGQAAAQAFVPGEGDPKPVATARAPRGERRMERAARRADLRQANRAGESPSYGENYGGKN